MLIERAISLVWVLSGAAAAWTAIELGLTGPSGPDSGLFPMIAAVLLCAGGVMLFVGRRHDAESVAWPTREGWIRLAGVVAGLALIALLLTRAGFVASGLLTMLVLLKWVERSTWVEALLLSVCSVAAVVALFDKLLGMPLPRGPWGF